jgi:hypothetical protein
LFFLQPFADLNLYSAVVTGVKRLLQKLLLFVVNDILFLLKVRKKGAQKYN